MAGAAEARDHLVGYEEHVVLAQERLQALEVTFRGELKSARAGDRVDHHGGDGLGPFRQDQILYLLEEARGVGLLVLARRHGAEHVGSIDLEEALERHVESHLQRREAGEARRRHGGAVVAPHTGDDLLLLGPAERVVVVPDQLDDGVVGFGA